MKEKIRLKRGVILCQRPYFPDKPHIYILRRQRSGNILIQYSAPVDLSLIIHEVYHAKYLMYYRRGDVFSKIEELI